MMTAEPPIKTETPTQFGGALALALEQMGVNQTGFARKIGTTSSYLNQLVRGRDPGPDACLKIVSALPAQHGIRVLIAWLNDATPAQLRHLVEVQPRDPSKEPMEFLDIGRLDKRRKMLIRWVYEKIDKSSFADWLDVTKATIEGGR